MIKLRCTWRQSIIWVFFLGLLLRFLSLNYTFGPQSLDDYRHVLFPALQWSQGEVLNIPGYRSHLLIWSIGSVFRLANSMGITETLSKLKLALFSIHILSVCFPIGLYYFLRRKEDQGAPLFTLAFICLNPILIFTSSRFLGESIAGPFLFLGLALMFDHFKSSQLSSLLGGLALIGLATLLRFQVGIIYLMFMFIMLFQYKYRDFFRTILIGILILSLQSLIDYESGKPLLGSLMAYLEINKNGGAEFGVTPWYATLFLFLGVILFPFSGPLIHKGWQKLVEMKIIVGVILGFVFIHGLIPHKEERFLFPVIPICIFLLSLLIKETLDHFYTKRIFIPLFVIINIGLLVLGLFSNSQSGVVDPIARLGLENKQTLVVDLEPKFGVYGLREIFFTRKTTYKEVQTIDEMKSFLDSIDKSKFSQIALFFSDPEKKNRLIFSNTHCTPAEKFHSWSDQVIFYLNPGANYRRAPTWRLLCYPVRS